MSLQFNCPFCQLLMSADDRFGGGQIQCPSCHHVFMVGAAAPVVPVVQPRQVAPAPQAQAPVQPARPGAPQPRPPGQAARNPSSQTTRKPAGKAKEEGGGGLVFAAIAGVILLGVGVIWGGFHMLGKLQEKAQTDPFALPPEVVAREAAQKAAREKEKHEQESEASEDKDALIAVISQAVCGGNDKVARELVNELAAIREELNAIYADADSNNDPKDLRVFYTEQLARHVANNQVLHHWMGGKSASSLAEALWGPDSTGRQHGKVADFLMSGAYSATGTGFFVSADGWLLTNEHVVGDAKEVDIRGADGSIRKARVIKTDKAGDVALLKADPAPAWLNLGAESAAMGASVFTIGFPNATIQGVEPKFTDGRVSSLSGMRDDQDQYQVTVPVQPGNSGGPLVEMKNGTVVGIVSSILSRASGADNVSYAVKTQVARRLVESEPQAKSVSASAGPASAGADVEAMAAKVKAAVVLVMVK